MSDLPVLGVGATSPTGLDARQCALFARAAKLAPRAYDPDGDDRLRIGTARVRYLPDDVVGTERMLGLAVPALREAVRSAGLDTSRPVPLFLSVPERRSWPDVEEKRLCGTFLAELAHRAQVELDVRKSEIVRVGHAGFALAIEHALAQREVCIIGGVDSHHHPEVLSELVQSMRILSEDAHAGMLPSEGAAFLVVGRQRGGSALGRIRGAACGMELPKTWEEPRVGELLTDLVYRVAGTLAHNPVAWLLTDVNGERHRVKERDYLGFRTQELISMSTTLETRLARELGDLGAATGAFYANHALQGFKTGFAPALEALVLTSSDGDARGVFSIAQADS